MDLDGSLLYVADTENHMIRVVDLEKKLVKTVAGTGKQSRAFISGGVVIHQFTRVGRLAMFRCSMRFDSP